MRIRFTRAGYALAAGVAVTAMLGMSVAAASASVGNAKPAATNACGKKCNDIFNQGLGEKRIPTTSGHYASPVHLSTAHNYLKSQDFIATQVGTLADFCTLDGGSGLIPDNAYVCINYPKTFPVYQEQYSPGSFTSDLCAAVGKNSVVAGGLVTLRVCGTSARALWIGDTLNSVKDKRSLLGFDVPLVNGADGEYSNPLVLTTSNSGILTIQPLMMNGGKVYDSQEWGLRLGPAF
jgi:hypothetical protein